MVERRFRYQLLSDGYENSVTSHGLTIRTYIWMVMNVRMLWQHAKPFWNEFKSLKGK